MRLIDADVLEKDIKETYCTGCNNYNGVRCRACWVDDALIAIDSSPTIEAEPVRHGKWSAGTYTYLCSECGQRTKHTAAKFCPECGAKMDGGVAVENA